MDASTSIPDPSLPVVPYLDAERFTVAVEQARGVALVDFTADWCPPCRVLAPHIDALARGYGPDVVVAKVDVDDHPEIAARFGVLSMPTLLFFRNGKVVDRIIGAVPPARLREKIKELRGS